MARSVSVTGFLVGGTRHGSMWNYKLTETGLRGTIWFLCFSMLYCYSGTLQSSMFNPTAECFLIQRRCREEPFKEAHPDDEAEVFST